MKSVNQVPPSNSNATGELASFIANSNWEDIPESVRHEGRRTLINYLASALGGCQEPAVQNSIAVLSQFSGTAEATLIGRSERLDILNASFINATASNLFDFDDTHFPTIIHPSAPVVPAVLALAERQHRSGQDMLHAQILGIEAECRLGLAVSPWHYAHGWHITSTCGVVGAAAAAGKMLGLDSQRMSVALSLGATQACGLLESLGTMAKSVSVGNAPRNGIVAAFLAKQGFLAAPNTLDGKYGFINVMGNKPNPGAILLELGSRWESARIAFKPYPCGIVLHPVIDALLALREEHELTTEKVTMVTVRAHPLLAQRTNRKSPRNGCEAQVSLQHVAAVCLMQGAAGILQFTDAYAIHHDVVDFGNRVEIQDDLNIAIDAADVTLRTSDGRILNKTIKHSLGSLGRPMSDAQLESKLRELAAYGAPGLATQPLIDAAWNIDRLPDAAVLAKLAQPIRA